MIEIRECPDTDQPTQAAPDGTVAQIKDETKQCADHTLSKPENAPNDYRKVTVADFKYLSMQKLIAYSNASARSQDWPVCILFRCEITGRHPTPLNYIFLSMAWEESGCILPALTYRLAAQYLDPNNKRNNHEIVRLQDSLSTPRVKFVNDTFFDEVTPEMMQRCKTEDLITYARVANIYGDKERAIFFRQEIVRREPYNFENRVGLAASFEYASRWVEAIKQGEAAQKLNPNDRLNNERLERLREKI